MATPISAQGAVFTFSDGASPVTVGGIQAFSGFDGSASDIDVTTLASTAKEFRQGLQDFGNFSIDLIFDPADLGQIEMRDAQAAQAVRQCVLTLVSGDVATFNAYVKQVPANGASDDVLKGQAVLKITGSVVWS